MRQANRRTIKIDSNIRDDWSRINQMSYNAALHRDQTDSNLKFILENEREHANNQINEIIQSVKSKEKEIIQI